MLKPTYTCIWCGKSYDNEEDRNKCEETDELSVRIIQFDYVDREGVPEKIKILLPNGQLRKYKLTKTSQYKGLDTKTFKDVWD